jgi:hypothetical protein
MFYKCMKLEDGDEEKCAPYARAYRSICPSDWYERGRNGGDAQHTSLLPFFLNLTLTLSVS